MAADNTKLATVFGHDTDVGRMLQGLYGRPKASRAPPPSRLKPMSGPQPLMVGLNSKPDAIDPRARTLNRAAMEIIDATKPSPVVQREVHVAKIDTVRNLIRRKDQIDEFVRNSSSVDASLPPLKRGYNTEAEKKKLQTIFQFKGGKTLPSVGLPEAMDGHIPFHMLTGQPRRPPRNAFLSTSASTGPTSKLLMELETTFDAVSKGLDESVAFIKELKSLGACTKQHEREHALELAERTRQLERLQDKISDERSRLANATAAPNASASASSAMHHSDSSRSPGRGGGFSSWEQGRHGGSTAGRDHDHDVGGDGQHPHDGAGGGQRMPLAAAGSKASLSPRKDVQSKVFNGKGGGGITTLLATGSSGF